MLDTADTVARSRLRSGEHLLWAGRPDPRRLFNTTDLFLVPFGLIFMTIAVVGASASARSVPTPFDLIPILFVVIGAYYVFGRFAVKRYRLTHSTYAITDRRAFALVGNKLIETPIGSERTTTSHGDSHATVLWNGSPGAFGLARGQVPANSGLDGILSPLPMGFFEVPEPAGMLEALDRASAHTPN